MYFHKIIQATLTCLLLASTSATFAQSISFDGLRVTLLNSRWSSEEAFSKFFVTLKLENTTTEGTSQALAVAAVLDGNNSYIGRPPKATLSEAIGAICLPVRVTGLRYGENADDWLVLRPGGSTAVTIEMVGLGRIAPPFHFNAELKLYKFDNRAHQVVPIYFGPLGEGPKAPRIYPELR